MSTITEYLVGDGEDPINRPWTYATHSFHKAADYAKEHHLAVIAVEYEYSDSTIVADYREEANNA